MKIFGILNVTPDSFSDGGRYESINAALNQAEQLFKDGADFVDVGAQATNPKATAITAKEEWDRLKTLLPKLVAKYPGKISLDTLNPETAEKFLKIGGRVLNDVSGFRHSEMVRLAGEYNPLCVVNHFPGEDAKVVHQQKIDDVETIKRELLSKRKELISAGVKPENVVLDPGIGFGKTMELNHKLLRFAELVPGIPVMIGHSRKRFLGNKRMEAQINVEAAKTAKLSGAKYIRVHDVRAHRVLAQS